MKTTRLSLALLTLLIPPSLGFPEAAPADGPDPRVKPGATFTVGYPDLPETLAHTPSEMHISIPTDYDPARKHPLFLWINVGTGGAGDPKIAQDITENKHFVCVSLPLYRTAAGQAKPGISGIHLEASDVPLIWPAYQRMLDDLEKIVPNLHPTKRLAGGGSNGGHAIAFLINETQGGFQKRFGHYFFWEGGDHLQDFKSITGRPALFCWGETSGKSWLAPLATQARTAKVDVETIEMPKVGHVFPEEYYPKFRDWIERKMLYAGLKESSAALDTALKGHHPDAACRALRDVLENSDDSRPELAKAQEALKTLTADGAQALEKMKAQDQTAIAWRKFVKDWTPCPCTDAAREACAPLARKELEAASAKTGGSRTADLRRFLADWEGFPVRAEGLAAYDEDAKKALEAADVASQSVGARAAGLQRFLHDWPESPSAKTARERLEDLAASELEKLRALPKESKAKTEEFLKRFEGTRAAEQLKSHPVAIPEPKKKV